MEWIKGRVIAGHGVASGRISKCPFPGGSIRTQQPFFLAHGIDLSPYYAGTLNVDLSPRIPLVPEPQNRVFDGRLQWFKDMDEQFILSVVEVNVSGIFYSGIWYYPHPDTKRDHFQPESVIELLLPWIDGLITGTSVEVRFCKRVL